MDTDDDEASPAQRMGAPPVVRSGRLLSASQPEVGLTEAEPFMSGMAGVAYSN